MLSPQRRLKKYGSGKYKISLGVMPHVLNNKSNFSECIMYGINFDIPVFGIAWYVTTNKD